MPCAAGYFLNRSTLAARSTAASVSSASGPSSSLSAATVAAASRVRVIGSFSSGDRGWSSHEVSAVDDEDVPGDVVGGAAAQEHQRAHQIDRIAPAGGRDVLDDPPVDLGVGAARLGDRRADVPGGQRIDLPVVLA